MASLAILSSDRPAASLSACAQNDAPGCGTIARDGELAAMQAVYYRTADGAQPVSEFVEGLSPERQVAIDNRIDRLNTLTSRANPHLEYPDSSQVDGELREL